MHVLINLQATEAPSETQPEPGALLHQVPVVQEGLPGPPECARHRPQQRQGPLPAGQGQAGAGQL